MSGRGPEVLRDTRTKESSSAVAMNPEERQSWQAQAREFLRQPRDETAKQKAARLRKVRVTLPRLATLDWMRAIEHQLKWACNRSWAFFDSGRFVEDATVQGGVVVFPEEAGLQPGSAAPLMVVTSDSQSTQIAAACFLQRKLGLNYEHLPDPFHASWNACMEGVTKAGYGGTIQAALCIFNIAYGPYQRSAFFKHLQGAAHDLSSSCSANDPLVLHCWPAICRERGMVSAEHTGEAARSHRPGRERQGPGGGCQPVPLGRKHPWGAG